MRGTGISVLVAGAGIAGLAAARTLRAWGANVELVERAPAAPTGGAGLFLPANGVRALDRLGLGEEVAVRSARIERQRVSGHRGRTLVDLDLAEVWGDTGPCLALPRADLYEVLLAGAKDVPIRWGVTPRSLLDTGDDVRVSFSDGTTERYDLVLGADGIHSTVRGMLFGAEATARPLGQLARRALLDRPPPEPVWSAMLGPGSTVLTMPVGGGRTYFYTDGAVGRLPSYAEPVSSLLAGVDVAAIRATPIEEVALPRWSRGCTLLIGDAAHATSPNMAQGVALAAEDALVLAECLAAGSTVTGALRSFEERRRPRTEWVRAQTHRRDRSRTLPSGLRDLVMRRFGAKLIRANNAPLRDLP